MHKRLQIADFVLGAFYENKDYNGRHVRGMLIGTIENKTVAGVWSGVIYVPGFDPIEITEGTESMLGWDRISEGMSLLNEPILSRKVEDLDAKDLEIERLRARIRLMGLETKHAEAAEDRYAPAN
jgi:hypothetical protein